MASSGEKRKVNPLLIPHVINRVLDYLPLKDLKQCRVVCQEWNSEAVKILNEKSKVNLKSEDRMKKFIELYKDYETEEFPFTSFGLVYFHTEGNTEEYEQLINLFHILRKNIITLRFTDLGARISLTPLIEKATNLVKLTFFTADSVVQLSTLEKVKYISLWKGCVSLDSFENRIAPLSISLESVTFMQNRRQLKEVLITDYIDFSRCSEIKIIANSDVIMTFDMSRDIFSARKVHFDGLRVINWIGTPAKANKRMLSFEKHTGMGIKELSFSQSEFNLAVLPRSLEKLSLEGNTYGTFNCSLIDLPNLKCFVFEPAFNDNTAKMSPAAYDMSIITSMFRLCPKLVDMELKGVWSKNWGCDINIDLLPVTLKRIKFSGNKNIKLVGATIFHVDILILDVVNFAQTKKFLNKIKPKVIVAKLYPFDVRDLNSEIASFIKESRNFEKIIITISTECRKPLLRLYEMAFLRQLRYLDHDDIESKFYELTNQIGKCLTREEFNMYWF